MNSEQYKINYNWVLIWIISNSLLGALFFNTENSIALSIFSFPLLQTFLIYNLFKSKRALFWLLNYIFWIIALYFIRRIGPFGFVIVNIIIGEILLFLITKERGGLIFATLSFLGLGIVFLITESYYSSEVELLFITVISIFTGLGIEMHRKNISD